MSVTAASPRGPTRRPAARAAATTAYTTGTATRSPVAGVPATHEPSPGTDPRAGSPTWDAAWASVLERAERDAAEAEALLARIHAEPDHVPDVPARWSPPPRLGPLPASLAVRAEAVLKRHQRLTEELTVAITENRRHRRALASLRPREAARPVYIDTEV